MPLNYAKLYAELNRKKDEFIGFEKDFAKELKMFKRLTKECFKLDYDEIIDKINQATSPVGAIPAGEYKKGLYVPAPKTFLSHNEMLEFAVDVLKNRMVGAVDGSQIYSSKEFSIPVGLIQVVLFTNSHSPTRDYTKEYFLEILTPDEIAVEDSEGNVQYKQESVDAARFEKEVSVITESMNQCKTKMKNSSQKLPLFFIDGTLILSFLVQFSQKNMEKQLATLTKLIDCSRSSSIPVIGYVDNSRAKDVITMINYITNNFTLPTKLTDAYIIEEYLSSSLKRPLELGARTCAFLCDRNDKIYAQYPSRVKSKIGFFYIKLSSKALARVEFPQWVLEGKEEEVEERLEKITEIVLAQAIVGEGYPYLIDQCHHACVIQGAERDKFYRIFQNFCDANNLSFKISNKARSKLRRTL